MVAEAKIVNKSEKLFKALQKIAAELEYGSFVTEWKVHAGELKEFEISEIKRKFKAE